MIVCGDSVSYIGGMGSGEVDLVVTSPPYDGLRLYGGIEWCDGVWMGVIEGLYRVMVDGGVVVWVVADSVIDGSESGTSFRQALFARECGFRIHDTMIYGKRSYMPLTHNRYEQQFEYVFIWSKGRPRVFNPIMEDCVTAGSVRNRGGSKAREVTYAEKRRDEVTVVRDRKIRGNVWFYDVGKNDRTGHNAPFPYELARDHIVSWSNEGDLVFDPFMGSGTTLLAARDLRRRYLGIDIVEEYCDMARERLGRIDMPLIWE